MKHLISVIIGTFAFVGILFASYTPTSTDQALISGFSAKITTMYQQNPTKIENIAPKLQTIVALYSDDTREHYVLNGLYMHIMSLLNTANAITNQMTTTTTTTVQAPVITTTTQTQPTQTTVNTATTSGPVGHLVLNEPFVDNNWSVVSYVSPWVYSDPNIQALYDVITSSQIKWNPDAEFTIVKFSDFECPLCQQYQLAWTSDAVLSHYQWKINYVLTHLVASPRHNLAPKAAEAAECIGKLWGSTAYYSFVDELFLWDASRARVIDTFDYISNWALNKDEFISCMDSGEMNQKVINSRVVWVKFLENLAANWDYNKYPDKTFWTPVHVFFSHKTGQFVVLDWAEISLNSWKVEVVWRVEPTL